MTARHDDYVRDWRGPGDLWTPMERSAYARGMADGIKRAWWRVAAGYVLLSGVLVLAFHALGVRP